MFCTKPQAKMLAFSFEAQTQGVKDMCLHFIPFSFFSFTLTPFCDFLFYIYYDNYHL